MVHHVHKSPCGSDDDDDHHHYDDDDDDDDDGNVDVDDDI